MVAAGGGENTIPSCLLEAVLSCNTLLNPIQLKKNKSTNKMVIKLTSKSIWCIYFILNLGCTLGFVPFSWNTKIKRLEHTTKKKLIIFYFFTIYAAWTWLYMTIQLIRLSNIKDVPPRIRIMNIIWGLTFCLIFLCKIQFITRKNGIKGFANELLSSISVKMTPATCKITNIYTTHNNNGRNLERGLPKMLKNYFTGNNFKIQQQQQKMKKEKENIDWIAIIIYFSTFLLIVNPPSHAVLIFDMPCAPQYISSLIFPCHWIGDRPVPAYEIIPFVLWENLIFMNVMSICAFYWLLIFLGLLWIKCELKLQMEVDQRQHHREQDFNSSSSNARSHNNMGQENDLYNIAFLYRKAQLMTILINHSFHLYLQYFPSLLFVIAGTLIFSTIRFTHLPFHIFIVFPACSFRCLFEASTQLEAAASLNLQSHHYLEYLSETIANKRKCSSLNNFEGQSSQDKKLSTTRKMIKYLITFKKSCTKLTCSSGSLYTFEKTIVLVSWHCCTQLVFNLLVAFPEAKETNWGNTISTSDSVDVINQTIVSN